MMTTAPRHPRLRPSALAAAALAGVFALTSCGSDQNDQLAQNAANDGTNYVAGDGSIQEYAPEDRGEPVEFESTLFDGTEIGPETWQGDVTVINFWYAACAPCRVEAPDLAEIHEEYEEEASSSMGSTPGTPSPPPKPSNAASRSATPPWRTAAATSCSP